MYGCLFTAEAPPSLVKVPCFCNTPFSGSCAMLQEGNLTSAVATIRRIEEVQLENCLDSSLSRERVAGGRPSPISSSCSKIPQIPILKI